MIKYLFACLIFILPFNFQVHWKCLDNGLEDIISKHINIKVCKYSEADTKDNVKVNITDKAILVLTKQDIKNGNYILFESHKYIINDKLSRNKINYNYDLLGMYSFKNKDGTFYLLQLNTSNGLNLNSKTLNLIVLFSNNKMHTSFIEWNSGNNLATSIGFNKGELFLLNNNVDSIKYYGFKNRKFIYNSKKSIKCRIDSTRKICVPFNYRF